MALDWLWLALCMAGVALGDIHLRFAWQAWHMVTSTVALRGRCVTYGTGLALQPVLVAVTPRHFAWQAWHLVTSTFVLRGRRGTYGPWSHIPSFRLASVALGDMHLRFAWQPWHLWHLWHWAGSGGALGPVLVAVTPRHFAWQSWHLVTSTSVLRGKRGTWVTSTVGSRGRRCTW